MDTFDATRAPAGMACPNQLSQIISSPPPDGLPLQALLGRIQMS